MYELTYSEFDVNGFSHTWKTELPKDVLDQAVEWLHEKGITDITITEVNK
jgi:hypothetical protein